MDYNAAREILKRYDARLLAQTPKGVGSALTHREGKWHLHVFVEERTNAHRWLEKLQHLEGLTVEVIETGKFIAKTIDPTAKHRPAFGGISVGHPNITAGTIGSLVWDLEKKIKYILSNNHVLANCNLSTIGDPIYQPGPYDGGTAADTLAHLSLYKALNFRGVTNYADCAIAEMDDPAQITAAIADVCDTVGVTKLDAAVGDPVIKSGRTTGVTTGEIQYFSGLIQVGYGDERFANFDDLIITTGMLAGGDSGSLLLSEDYRPVGLMFAGNESEQLDASCRIGYVLDYLPIVFAGDEPYLFLKSKYAIEEYQKTLTCSYNILDFSIQLDAIFNVGVSPYPIYTLRQLQKMYGGTSPSTPHIFELKNDIDCTPTRLWNWDETLGIYKGFDPLDVLYLTFYGDYNMINGLYINRPDEDNIGLFGSSGYLTLEKIVLQDMDITGLNNGGGLLGKSLGCNNIRKCVGTGMVEGYSCIGGMIGLMQGSMIGYEIEKCQFTGTTKGVSFIGGLIGSANAKMNDCYVQGVMEGIQNVGGICGSLSIYTLGLIVNCYSSAYIKLASGINYNNGGIYGRAIEAADQTTSSYWDSDVCSEIAPDDSARTTIQMQNRDTFIDWDFDTVWNIIQFQDYPRLKIGMYWGEILERLGFNDTIVGINLMGRLHEWMAIADYVQLINLRDTIPESIGIKDVIHNYLEYLTGTQENIGFADFLKINTYGQRFLTPKIGLKDTLQFLNWTQFLKQNKAFLIERYFCYLSHADGLNSIELPMSSFQGRRRKDASTYLSVVIPDSNFYQQIVDRDGGVLSIYMGYEFFGEIYLRQMIMQVDLEDIYYDDGTNEQSIQLVGHKTYAFSPKTEKIENASYKRISNGLVTIRCATPDLFLNPGDTVITDDENFECGAISYMVSVEQSSMEVTEIEAA